MPPPPTLKIFEIFASIQGEGLRQGEVTIFVRVAGCDRRCSFCDTKYAWDGGRESTAKQVVEQVVKMRAGFPAHWVCITGGEPFMQDLRPLVRLLHEEKFLVHVETNGMRYYPLRADWFSVSPKPLEYYIRPEFRRRASEVKLVVTADLDLAVLRKMRAAFPAGVPIILQPESNLRWSQKRAVRLIREALTAGLNNMRVSVQLHKILRLR
jgi:organic radical activating enzyme